MRRLRGGDDGEVVRHLGRCRRCACGLDVAVVQAPGGGAPGGAGYVRQSRRCSWRRAGSPRAGRRGPVHLVSQDVALIKGLGQGQRGSGTETEFAVGLALQAGQVGTAAGWPGWWACFPPSPWRPCHLTRRGYCRHRARPQAVGAGLGVVAFLPLGSNPLAQVLPASA